MDAFAPIASFWWFNCLAIVKVGVGSLPAGSVIWTRF